MLLSILIPSTTDRQGLLDILLSELNRQIKEYNAVDKVEILTSIDNYEATTGFKRNELLNRACGDFVISVDSDDWVYPHYISELLKAAESGADCFKMHGIMSTNGMSRIEWTLSKDYPNDTIFENGIPRYRRKTNHITGVRREIALMAGFPDKSNAEDKDYSEGINPHLKTEYEIKPIMYHYRYQNFNKSYK